MSTYLVCYKKRNNPRIDIRICMQKCTLKNDCRDFQNYQKTAVQRGMQSLSLANPEQVTAA